MNDEDHPSFGELVDWVEGRIDPISARRVEQALAAREPRTTAALRWLSGFRATARAMPLHDPPPIVRQNLRRHFRRSVGAPPDHSAGLVEHTARLVFDSRRDLGLVGLRAGDDADRTVHMAFTAPGADLVVDLHQNPACADVDLEGQVFLDGGPDGPGVFEAVARGDGWTVRTVDGDELGRFRLDRLPRAALTLRVTNGEIALTAALDVRDPDP